MEDNYSVLKRVKKKRIPNAPRKYGSLVFDCLKEGSSYGFIAAAQKHSEFLPKTREQKLVGKRLRAEALERIKIQYPLEVARTFNSKKKRRAIKHLFNQVEFQVFCEYTKSLGREQRQLSRRQLRIKHRTRKREKTGYRLTYSKYINSDTWREIKNSYYQKFPRKCAACQSSKKIHLHHMVYGNFGDEKEEDLIPLCEPHHAEYHKKNGTKRNMKRTTLAFIEEIKSQI